MEDNKRRKIHVTEDGVAVKAQSTKSKLYEAKKKILLCLAMVSQKCNKSTSQELSCFQSYVLNRTIYT